MHTQPTTKVIMNDEIEKQEGEQLVEILEIENSPMTIVRHDKDWYVCIGKYRLTEALPSQEDAEKDLRRMDWWRIMQVIQLVYDQNKEQEEMLNIAKQK